jgi:hypothetical protein
MMMSDPKPLHGCKIHSEIEGKYTNMWRKVSLEEATLFEFSLK